MPVLLPSPGTVGGSAFPDGDLELVAQAAFGADLTASPDTWDWTDLTCAHPSFPTATISRLLSTPITIRRGVAVGASTTTQTTGTLHLLNHDGALTPGLVTSPHWPYVDAGTPIRLRARTQRDLVDTFSRTESNGWGTADSGETWTPVTSSSGFATTGSQATITFNAVNATHRINIDRVIRDIDVVFDIAVNAVATGAAHSVGPNIRYSGTNLYRYWCAVELGLAGAVNLRVRRYFNSAGTATTISNETVGSLTYGAGTLLRVRARVVGTSIRMRAWLATDPEPSTWTVDITDTLITGHNAALSATDVLQFQASVFASNTNTPPIVFTLDNITAAQAYSDRLEGYITDVRPVYLPQPDGSTWSTVQVDVGGIKSRLEKNEAPAYSPLRRSVQLADTPPIAYWPLEDAEKSTHAASAFPGHPQMNTVGPVVFSFDGGETEDTFQARYGSKPMASVAAGAGLVAVVPPSTVQTEWAVSIAAQLYVPEVPATSEIRIMQWETSGGVHNRWSLVATTTGYQCRAYNDVAGTSTNVTTDTVGPYAGLLSFTVQAVQNGANVDVTILYNDNAGSTGSVASTLAAVTKVTINPDRANTTAALTTRGLRFIVGHLRITDETSVNDVPHYTDPDSGTVVYAGNAWFLESAHGRVDRLCAEERVPCTILGDPGETGLTRLNTQRDGGFTDLVTQAAESESGGILYERGFGYCYLPRSARYDQDVALTVDLASYRRTGGTDPGDVLVPQLDARTATVWTVQRHNGGEGSAAAPAAYRARRGTIGEQVVLDVLYDDDTAQHASWRLHQGVDGIGSNYPAMPLDLLANPDLIDDWLDCDIGSRVQRTNQPSVAGVGTIDQVIEGYTETLGPRRWDVSLVTAPASVWDVGVYDDTTYRYDSASTTVKTAVTVSGTSIVFRTTDGGDLWSTTDTPYDVIIAGQRNTVTSMGAASVVSGAWEQTATVTRGVDGIDKALDAGNPIHIATPGRWVLS